VLERDAIPSVDDPTFGTGYDGDPDDTVVVIEADPPRAYPLRYLDFHEVVNDTVDGRPVAVTWCPLCGSSVVYDRRVGDRTLTFGVSGKLADDDLVLYDRETESEWKQSLGEAIDGPLDGTRLDALPATTTTWAAFADAYDGVVLQPPGGESEAAADGDQPAPIDYDERPYERYAERDGFGLAAHRGDDGREWDRAIPPKTVVAGLTVDGDALGVPQPVVERAGGVVRATVGGRDVVVVDADGSLQAFVAPDHPLAWRDGALSGGGTTWDPLTGESADGRRLERVPVRRLYAFAWQDDHGADAILTEP